MSYAILETFYHEQSILVKYNKYTMLEINI